MKPKGLGAKGMAGITGFKLFEPTAVLQHKSSVYGLNGRRALFVIALSVAACEHAL